MNTDKAIVSLFKSVCNYILMPNKDKKVKSPFEGHKDLVYSNLRASWFSSYVRMNSDICVYLCLSMV